MTEAKFTPLLNWINLKFGVDLNEVELESVKYFSLFWNIFEDKVCGRFCTADVIERSLINNTALDWSQFEEVYSYFSNRYVTNRQTNDRFEHLKFRAADKMLFVSTTLTNTAAPTNEKIIAIAIIIFRLRNNLFHGEKDIRLINEQKDNFENANKFLMALLNYYL
ncbi:MAG: hypothetical protein QM530_00960 [Phycisphaerales bacterium]|nr:hypothetical protein [Phycisphaerales bacterium]